MYTATETNGFDMTRKTILVLAYSVSPVRGSEYSVGWNYIREMCQDHNLIVLYGLAGDHMGDLDEVERSPICQGLPNVEWIAVRPNWIANLLNTPNRKGRFVYSFYIAYKFWHRQVFHIAKDLVQTRSIDLIHYLCPIGYREPGYLWKIDKPYIWGPISGMDNRSVRLAFEKSLAIGCKIGLRNAVNSIQFKFSPRVRAALARTDVLLAATSGCQQRIAGTHNIATDLLAENGILDSTISEQRLVTLNPGSTLRMIWVGSIEERKSLEILLEALGTIKSDLWELTIIGGGPMKNACTVLADSLGINDKITWAGKVSRDDVNRFYREAHLHIVTSLLEGNPTVIWEAMAFGIPTLALNHFGMHDVVCEKCGQRVPVSSSMQSLIEVLANRIQNFLVHPHLIAQLSTGVLECSRSYLWSTRRSLWNNYYETAIKRWQEKRRGM